MAKLRNCQGRNRPPDPRRRHGRLRRRGRGRLLGQAERPEGDPGRQGRHGPLRRGGHGPVGHQPVRGPQGRRRTPSRTTWTTCATTSWASPARTSWPTSPATSTPRVHLFEKWGLPIWKDEKGAYVHEGRWQLMINGESYKVVVAEAAKNALLQPAWTDLRARLHRRPAHGRRARARAPCGFSVRENKFYVFKAKATLVAMGGAVHVFKPAVLGRGPRPRLVSAMELRLLRLLHPQGRRRDDLPGSALHPGPLQGRLRSGRARGSCSSSPAPPTPWAATTWSSARPSWRSGGPTAT